MKSFLLSFGKQAIWKSEFSKPGLCYKAREFEDSESKSTMVSVENKTNDFIRTSPGEVWGAVDSDASLTAGFLTSKSGD